MSHLSWFLLLFEILDVLLPINSLGRIGVVSSVSPHNLIPFPSGSTVTKKSEDPFEIYCGRDVLYNQCRWNWPTGGCSYFQHVNGSDFNFCPFEVRTDVRGNCLASLTAFEAEKHQGIWQCGLSSDDIDDISKMNLTIMTHVQARIGNVQLFVNLVSILYARWRFKIV